MEILVVDNASYDGCESMLQREFPTVRFIQCENNVGFARANNLAFECSRGRAVLFLNPDTELVGPAINLLLKSLGELRDVGAVGARLLNSDGSLQTSCVQAFPTVVNQVLDAEVLRQAFSRLRLWGTAALFNEAPVTARVEAIAGACVMMKREVFERVGGFDQNYFMYCEDIDLSYKLQQAGLHRYYVPAATIIHHGGGSSRSARSNFSSVMMRESVYRFMEIRRGPFSAGMYRVALGAAAVFRLPLAVLCSLGKDGETIATRDSVWKWVGILRWSVGMERWARRRRGGTTAKQAPDCPGSLS